MENITLGAIIMAVVEAIKSVDSTGKVSGWVTPLIAMILGGLAGYFHLVGAGDISTGIVVGLASVGVHTVASAAGGR